MTTLHSSTCLWDCLFCLLPSLLLLLFSLASRGSQRVRRWLRLGGKAAGWRLCVAICWILELPPPRVIKKTTTWTQGTTRPPEDGAGKASGPDLTSERPSLTCQPTALAHYLLRHCGSLARPRLATWPGGDPHIQTLSGLLCGGGHGVGGGGAGDDVQFTRDHLLLRDGGVVALDWAVGARERGEVRRGGARTLGGCYSSSSSSSSSSVLLLIPHSWGGVTPHLKGLCRLAVAQGLCAVVFNPRGTAGCPLTTPRLTEFGDPSDLVQAVAYVRSRHPSAALLAVSEGSGSGLLLSYLGECGSSAYVAAAAAISPVLQGRLWFDTAMPSVYRWGALLHRKLQLGRYESSFRDVLDVDQALRCSSLRDFEEALFCSKPPPSSKPPQTPPHAPPPPSPDAAAAKPGAGCPAAHPPADPPGEPSMAWGLGERSRRAKDWDGYWERNEPLRDADEVAVPVLCICSRDDPLLPPPSAMPLPLFQSNPYFLLVMTDRGGHCGFTLEGEEGEADASNWSHVAVLEYFKVVAEFLKMEERDGARGGGVVGAEGGYGGQWGARGGRASAVVPAARRRRATAGRRRQTNEAACGGGEEGGFIWKRSYTR